MLILASKSPRRQELLRLLDIPFKIIPSHGEEIVPNNPQPNELAKLLAIQKAAEVSARYPDDTVIGADTIVVCQNEVLGKPKNHGDAMRMLTLLSGRVHSVFTGVSVQSKEINVSFDKETLVEFYPLTNTEIERYIKSGEPFDKSGAYGIQGKGSLLVKRIEGDYYNVMGLPISELYRVL